jgi:glycosyltransferase involved in cell wall biosynthesis
LPQQTQPGPLISVVMSCHNGRETLARALASLLWQSHAHWELILLDDGSDDGSAGIAQALGDPRIHVHADGVRRGLAARLNEGVRLARGDYVARMDVDDVAFPERLARQSAFLQANPEVDLLATAALMVDGDDRPVGILRTGSSHEDICRRAWHGFPMPHPTWMGRTTWFLRNPYDERAHKAQDQSLLYRTHRTSRFAGLQEVLLGYRYARLSVKKTLIGRYHFLRAVARAGRPLDVLAGVGNHGLAAARDLLGCATGMDAWVIARRVHPFDAVIAQRWDGLMRDLAVADGRAEPR